MTPDQARTVTVGTMKGGAGKTSLSAAVASEAARLGARVLVIDYDPNKAMTISQFGYDVTDDDMTIGDVIADGTPGSAAGAMLAAPGEWQPNPDLPWEQGGALPGGALAFIPNIVGLDAVLTDVSTKPMPEQRLAKALSGVASQFDLVLIDTPPRSDRLMWLALLASAHVLCVTTPEAQTIDGLPRTFDLIEGFHPFNPDLRMLGTAITRYDARSPKQHGAQVQQARALHDHPVTDLGDLTDHPPFRRVTHPGIPGVVPETTSGCVLMPEVLPAAGYVGEAHNRRMPVHHGMIPTNGGGGEGLSFFEVKEGRTARQHVLRYTRLALRVLHATGSPAMPRITENLAAQPIEGLWEQQSLRGDGTDFTSSDDTTAKEKG